MCSLMKATSSQKLNCNMMNFYIFHTPTDLFLKLEESFIWSLEYIIGWNSWISKVWESSLQYDFVTGWRCVWTDLMNLLSCIIFCCSILYMMTFHSIISYNLWNAIVRRALCMCMARLTVVKNYHYLEEPAI